MGWLGRKVSDGYSTGIVIENDYRSPDVLVQWIDEDGTILSTETMPIAELYTVDE